MACCTSKTKKYTVFSVGIILALLALILGLLWPALSIKLLHSQLVLKKGSQNYNAWIETPIPIYMEIFMFNWTNSDQVHNPNVKPNFEEVGPYVFREQHKRVDLEWHDNATISFNQTRTWHFEEEMSVGSLDDNITNLNVIFSTVAYMVRNDNKVIKWFAELLLRDHGGDSIFVTKPVRELLFDGYDDPLLDFLEGLNSPTFNIPFSRFGWFAERNNSEEYDGRFNMYTGADDINNLGILHLWNNKSHVEFYRGQCGMVNGTTGELWPPLKTDLDISVFATDVCRTVTIKPDAPYEKFGVKGHRWIGDERVFDNGLKYPPNACFCTSEERYCPDMPYGVMNVSDCKFGAPAFVSYPHFYLAAPSYLDRVTGLKPNKSLHEFSVALEPTTGIPLEVKAQLQINLLLQPIPDIKYFENVPHTLIPMFWFRQIASLNEELAKDAKLALSIPMMGIYTSIGMGCIGIIIILIAIALTILNLWGDQNAPTELINAESQNDITDDKMIS